MNLEEIYSRLALEEMTERIFQEELAELEKMEEGRLKEIISKRTSREKVFQSQKTLINESLAKNPNTPAEILKELMEDETFKAKSFLAQNPNTSLDVLYQLYDMGYSDSLVKNPNVPAELLQQIYDNTIANPEKNRGDYNPNTHILYDIAKNPNTPQEILRDLSISKDRISGSETIQGAVAQNPSTPLDILENFAELDKGCSHYSSNRGGVLRNPNIPMDLMNKIISMHSSSSYEHLMQTSPSLFTPEYVAKLKREEGMIELAYLLVYNPNLSPDMLQFIEKNINSTSDSTHNLSAILKNPNTPSSIITKYADRLDYRVMPGSLYSDLYSIVKNPNTPTQVLGNIRAEIEKRDTYANCRYVMNDLLKNPNTPQEILGEYLQKAIYEKETKYSFASVLENPSVFDVLRTKQIAQTPLQQKEAELSSLETEEKTITETEKLIAQKENEGQTILE